MKTTEELKAIYKRLYRVCSRSELFRAIAEEEYTDAVTEADKDMTEENIQRVMNMASKLLGAMARYEFDSKEYSSFKVSLIIKGGYSQEEVEGWAR